jgi:hypothetical protein
MGHGAGERGDGALSTGPRASERERKTVLGGEPFDRGGESVAGGFDDGSLPVVGSRWSGQWVRMGRGRGHGGGVDFTGGRALATVRSPMRS